MKPEKKWKCMKYSTVIGAMLIIFPDGLYWYWGNLSVYTISYYVSILDVTSDIYSPWIISAFLICWTVGSSVSASITRRVGRRYTVLIGAVITNVGISSSYFAVQYSIAALTISLGVVMGLGTGLSDSSVLQMVLEWSGKDAGTLTALVQGSMSLGGFIINQLITVYTNPRNLSPDYELGRMKYFTQKEVLHRVPSMFFILACIAASSQIIGFLMLRQRDKEEAFYDLHDSSSNSTDVSSENISYMEYQPILNEANETKKQVRTSQPVYDYTPTEMMTSISFYALWLTAFLGDMAFLVLINYYKLFGQLWIKNDQFLTTLGTVFVLANACMSFLWGIAMDKYGVKNCFILNTSCSAIIQAWYYFGPLLNKWLYAVETVLLGCFGGALISCYTTAIALIYGKTHFTSNYGIFMTSTLAFNFIAPFLLESIITDLGWFALFDVTAGCNLIRIIILMIFVPSI